MVGLEFLWGLIMCFWKILRFSGWVECLVYSYLWMLMLLMIFVLQKAVYDVICLLY